MAILSYENFIATMAQIETEAPPAYRPYERDVPAGQTGADSDASNLTNYLGEWDHFVWTDFNALLCRFILFV